MSRQWILRSWKTILIFGILMVFDDGRAHAGTTFQHSSSKADDYPVSTSTSTTTTEETTVTTEVPVDSMFIDGELDVLNFLPSSLSQQQQQHTTSSLDSTSCSSYTSCDNCTHTYSCHWCNHDQSCHARGSWYGCAWGGRCDAPPKPPKENSTCASHMTCSECATSSHFCHWCEHDNACHAVGSRYGCSVGVDCYSNERCRRNVSQPLYPSSDIVDRVLPEDMPSVGFMVICIVGLLFICCFSCCHYFATNVKGAYDDLATITMEASRAPMSVIGGPTGRFYTTLEPHLEDVGEDGEGDEEGENQVDNDSPTPQEESGESQHPEDPPATAHSDQQQQGRSTNDLNDTDEGSPYHLMADNDRFTHNHSHWDNHHHQQQQQESRPLLHPSFNGSVMEEPLHMKRLYRACSILYFTSVGLVVMCMISAVYFYPSKPIYNVCNDAVAWKRIMGNIVKLEIDASFEILISLKNANRITASLDVGKGSFKFEGKPIGRYEIPPVTAPASSITDIMLVTHVTPDKYQALQLAEAYYMGKLILEAEFDGTIRVPALWDFTFDVHIKNIHVDVNELSDRSLCHCPTWDDGKNHSASIFELPEFFEQYY